jgi:hypothetical protein
MSIDVWIPERGMSAIEFQGHLEFRDIEIPIAGKDEWGADTLTRTLQGPGSRIQDFLQTLKQGASYKTKQGVFFLQSWVPIPHKCFPGVTLIYKGLVNDDLPPPVPSTSRSEIMSTLTATGLSITVSSGEDEERTITGGSREVRYVSPTTVWRYMTRELPVRKKFVGASAVQGTGIEDRGSVIFAEFDDGTTQRMVNAPAGLATALFAQPYVDTVGPSFDPIIGTPYYECLEVCQLRYPDS